jgi:ATP-dependent DNA helicase RecG
VPELSELPVTALSGVGPALAEKLERLSITTVQDLLFLLPLRYEDRTRVVPIGSVRPGQRCVVEGEIQLTEVVYRRRRMLASTLSDGTGWLTMRLFHFSRSQQAALARGTQLRCFGEVRGIPGKLEMIHPEYKRIGPAGGMPLEETLTPVYPGTEGIQQGRLRRLTDIALELLERNPLTDWLGPGMGTASMRLPSLDAAIRQLHRPPLDASLEQLGSGRHPAQRRLAFEELLAHQLSLRQLRARAQQDDAPALEVKGPLYTRFLKALPFTLTGAQQRVLREIGADIGKPVPMLRLLQGDVGSGKTVVAAAAALCAVDSGMQAALMAPTELLADQHLQTLTGWLEPLGVKLAWLSSSARASERKSVLAALASGEAQIAVGTHALFQEGVEFRDLALAIVDEQHRFGVHQRLRLREKGLASGTAPHQLIMSATPIPRTLAMTAYADLDVSVIDERPPGRKPVTTAVLPAARRPELIERVAAACSSGRQAYWVCPLIEESETLARQAAEDMAASLAEALPELSVGLVHGRMRGAQKERVMAAFKRGECDLLVATTVIEVGVDVANATLMVIENAETLGLAQLHQLRGRVGRGSGESSCILLYEPPLSATARRRLEVMRETDDGFEVARQDLELRGPGEVLGTRQTGLMQLRVADLLRDIDLLPEVQKRADAAMREQPDSVEPLIRRWIGAAERFGQV